MREMAACPREWLQGNRRCIRPQRKHAYEGTLNRGVGVEVWPVKTYEEEVRKRPVE